MVSSLRVAALEHVGQRVAQQRRVVRIGGLQAVLQQPQRVRRVELATRGMVGMHHVQGSIEQQQTVVELVHGGGQQREQPLLVDARGSGPT